MVTVRIVLDHKALHLVLSHRVRLELLVKVLHQDHNHPDPSSLVFRVPVNLDLRQGQGMVSGHLDHFVGAMKIAHHP